MKVECCACGHTYPLTGNVFQASPGATMPLLRCPHCGLEHIISFLPVNRRSPKPIVRHPAKTIKLGQVYTFTLAASRICNSNKVDQSGSDDGDVTDWTRTADFILACACTADKVIESRNYKLQWRNVTEDGSFADVGAATEIDHNATTVLVDNRQTFLIGETRCSDPVGYTFWNTRENEGDNTCSMYTSASPRWNEMQWALSCGGATYSHEYQFLIYDTTEAVTIGTAASSITIEADPAGGCPRQMMHYALRRRA